MPKVVRKKCPHGRRKNQCGACGGAAICQHGRRRNECRACKGSSICQHGRRKTHCKECVGSAICEHGRQKTECHDCVPLSKKLQSPYWCHGCASVLLSTNRRRAGETLCATCLAANSARTELAFRALLVDAVGWAPSAADNLMLGGSGCDGVRRRRPDLAWVGSDRVVFAEIDEDGGHPNREPACELAKVWDQTEAVKRLLGEATVVLFIRINPDQFDGARVGWPERAAEFGRQVRDFLASDLSGFNAHHPHLRYMFYHSNSGHQIEAARAQEDSLVVLE